MISTDKQSISDIQEEIVQIKKDLLDMKIKQKTRQQIKPHLIKQKKHRLAQLSTLEHQLKSKNH